MKKYIFFILLLTGLAFTNPPAFTTPKVIEGTIIKNIVTDREAIDKLDEVIYQLKIFNEYMSRMTGEEISKSDIE